MAQRVWFLFRRERVLAQRNMENLVQTLLSLEEVMLAASSKLSSAAIPATSGSA